VDRPQIKSTIYQKDNIFLQNLKNFRNKKILGNKKLIDPHSITESKFLFQQLINNKEKI